MKPAGMQLEFAWRDETALRRELEEQTGLHMNVVVTDNASTLMSLKHERGGAAAVRLHHMFLRADPGVVRALAAWVKRPTCRRSGAVLNAFIRDHRHLIRSASKRAPALRTQGAYFDLRALFDVVNREHFADAVDVAITWGRRPTGSRRRSIRFGSYALEDRLIRIHPHLDQAFVPEYFVRYIVFHEMLHAYLGIEESERGRRRIHTPEFSRIERAYPDYARAEAWQRRTANLRRLLRPPGDSR